MKYIQTFLIISIFFLSGCSSKNKININENIKSLSLSNSVYIEDIQKTVNSPISFNFGVGGYISKHVGVSAGSSVRPKIKNTDGLNLQKALSIHSISLENNVLVEFKKQMSNDSFYKNKFVPFGADYIINLSVKEYKLDNSVFSSKSHIKILLKLELLNKNADLVYSDLKINEIDSSNYYYTESQILNDKNILKIVLNDAIKNSISELIKEMKKK